MKSSSLILSIFVVLLFLFSAPSAFAQTGTDCKLTPSAPSCLSFDPSVNPILIAQKLVYPTNPGGQNLQNIPEKGVCQEYRDSSFSLSQGCLNKGVFKWTSEDVSPEGNLTTPTADSTGNVTSDTGTAVGNVAATVAVAVTGGDCTAWNPLTYGSCALKGIAGVILEFANVLLGIAGVLFNLVIVKTVFEFANVIGNSPGLLLAWGILRDIGNMALLFGFIFMGIATILDLHNYNAKKTLPFLIIFAILMNFSLFAAEVVIDTSNVFSSVLYNQANSSPCDTVSTNESDDARKCLSNNGLAGQVLQATGLSTIWKTDRPDIAISTYLLLALFVTITAVVLFAGAIMLIIRAVTLTFLMVTAPIGFAGMAIPMLHGAAKQWWSALIAQSFFAPVFILCILISLKITEGLSGGGGTSSFVDALSNNDTVFLEVLVIFALVIGFMVMSLYVAKKMGAMGAGYVTNGATKFAFGSGALLTNQVLNRAGAGGRKVIQRFPNNRVARFATKNILTPMEKTNFDLRKVPFVGKGLGAVGLGDGAKPNDNLTVEGLRDMVYAYHEHEDAKDHLYDKQIKESRLAANIKTGNLTPDDKAYLGKLAVKELEAMPKILEKAAKVLSPEQVEGLLKSEKMSQIEKDKLIEARYADLSSAVAGGITANIKAQTRDMSKGELESIPARLLAPGSALYQALSESQREDLSKSKKRTDAERQLLRESSPVFVIQNAYDTGGAVAVRALPPNRSLGTLTFDQAAKLSRDVLVDPDLSANLTPGVLIKLAETNKLSMADMFQVGENIRLTPVNPANVPLQKLKDFVTVGPGSALW